MRNDLNLSYTYYNMHDGKMLYALIGHSLFNRKFNPFLLCTCNCGAGVVNENHICQILLHNEQVQLFDCSLRKWINQRKRIINTEETYEYFDHMDWVDVNNNGLSHFGLHPDLLPQDSIRFDVFHMRCAITRSMMNSLRKFMLQQTVELIQDLSEEVLLLFWSEYNILVWILNKSFQSLIRSELLQFIKHIPQIVNFLKDKFHTTESLQYLRDGLLLFLKITPFLVITTIDNVEEYKKKMLEFNTNIKLFYNAGKYTFLTKNVSSPGDDETFYLHCLRFYIPQIAEVTLKKHNLGVGIFTMQGFERRNKESKNTFKRFRNGKGNVLVSNIKRLYDVFFHDNSS